MKIPIFINANKEVKPKQRVLFQLLNIIKYWVLDILRTINRCKLQSIVFSPAVHNIEVKRDFLYMFAQSFFVHKSLLRMFFSWETCIWKGENIERISPGTILLQILRLVPYVHIYLSLRRARDW